VILDEVIDWCLAHPEKFLRFGDWGTVVAVGLIILGVAIYLYEGAHLQNEDGP